MLRILKVVFHSRIFNFEGSTEVCEISWLCNTGMHIQKELRTFRSVQGFDLVVAKLILILQVYLINGMRRPVLKSHQNILFISSLT